MKALETILRGIAVIILVALVVLYGLAILGFVVGIIVLLFAMFVVSQITGQRLRVTKDKVVIGYVKWFRYVPVNKSRTLFEAEQAGKPQD
jgi:hypothetical protein